MVYIRGMIAAALTLCLASPVSAQDDMPQASQEDALATTAAATVAAEEKVAVSWAGGGGEGAGGAGVRAKGCQCPTPKTTSVSWLAGWLVG